MHIAVTSMALLRLLVHGVRPADGRSFLMPDQTTWSGVKQQCYCRTAALQKPLRKPWRHAHNSSSDPLQPSVLHGPPPPPAAAPRRLPSIPRQAWHASTARSPP